MKKYKAIFFDWDGTAVVSRKAAVDNVIGPMKQLLSQGVKLAIISGTTIENIAGGKLHEWFTPSELGNLYLGLGRGAYNYMYSEEGAPYIFNHTIPSANILLDIHRTCFDVHEELLEKYNFPTDIVFSRPNYCKIDLMIDNSRGDHLFFQENELESLERSLSAHNFNDGLQGLIQLAIRMGKKYNLNLSVTTDAKYLEVGLSNKSDNVDTLLAYFKGKYAIQAVDCAFYGDEYVGMDEELFGSDSFMITASTKEGEFFDVSTVAGKRPDQVTVCGGGVERFIQFLEEQGNTHTSGAMV